MTDEGISYILKNCDVQQDQFLFEKYWWPLKGPFVDKTRNTSVKQDELLNNHQSPSFFKSLHIFSTNTKLFLVVRKEHDDVFNIGNSSASLPKEMSDEQYVLEKVFSPRCNKCSA